MYRKVEDYECELNVLRRDNEDLRKRLSIMQDTLRKYQIEKREILKKYGVKNLGPKEGD